MKDPIVEEVRRFRDEHSKRFNYDLDAICEDYKAHQVQVGSRLVRLKPKIAANKAHPPDYFVTALPGGKDGKGSNLARVALIAQ